VVEADDKPAARINCIAHLLSVVPYTEVRIPEVKLPPLNQAKGQRGYDRPPPRRQTEVPDHAGRLSRSK
jgi:hypothetical protein